MLEETVITCVKSFFCVFPLCVLILWVSPFSLYCYLYQDKSATSNLKIEALVFTRLVLASHSPCVFHPYIKVIVAHFSL